MYTSSKINSFIRINVILGFLSFLLPLWAIHFFVGLGVGTLLFGTTVWLLFFCGYLIAMKSRIWLFNAARVASNVKQRLQILASIAFCAYVFKVMHVGLPDNEGLYGRAYEAQFMATGKLTTVLFLFLPVIGAALISHLKNPSVRIFLAVLFTMVIFTPGIKGNVFLFLFCLLASVWFIRRISLVQFGVLSFLVSLITFSLFFGSHFLLRGTIEGKDFSQLVTSSFDLIINYFVPNFLNLALTVDRSDIFQYGAVFLFPIVDQVSFGLIRTIGAEGQVWYFVDPSLKAGTFARDLWQDFGWFGTIAGFFLGGAWGLLQKGIFHLECRAQFLPVGACLFSFPIAFMFFYNEFNRSQVIFGYILLLAVYLVPDTSNFYRRR